MENNNGLNNIISTYTLVRKKLDNIELLNDINDNQYYNNYFKEIASDYDCLAMIETLYLDSFVLLNFKKKLDIITVEERKIYLELFRSFRTDKASLSISFYTNERIRNNIIKTASEYRKNNILSKARMLYMLGDIFIEMFIDLKFEIKTELSIYNFDMNHLKNYIYNNSENRDLVNQLTNYFKFLFLYDYKKYSDFVYYIRLKIGSINYMNSPSFINDIEISNFVKTVISNKKQTKILEIIKKPGD